MATVVKLGNTPAVMGLVEGIQNSLQHSQSCKLQRNISSLRSAQRSSSAVLSPYLLVSYGNTLFKFSRTDIQFKAMALPLDRKSVEDNGSESEVAASELEELEEPWLGAVMFKRSGRKSHYEFHTSLERLGLGKLSTEASRALANSMGLNSASSAPRTEICTPVSISIDVSREEDRRDLRLDGIVRTTVTLCCNRCLSPVVERVFASFNLLLTEKPVVEPTQQRLGVVLGDSGLEDDEPELDLDLDDKLYFPREAKEMDLSKYLRDSVHLEIPYKSLCSIQCAGLCVTCGVNLNERTCNCTEVNVKPSWGPLEQLRRQLKEDEGLQ